MSCHLGTEKMPIILDQSERDSNAPDHGLFHALELSSQQHGTNCNSDQNYISDSSNGVTFKIVTVASKEPLKPNPIDNSSVAKKMAEESLKKYSRVLVTPHLLFNSTELLNFSNGETHHQEHDQSGKIVGGMRQTVKTENKKLRRLGVKVESGFFAGVQQQAIDLQNGIAVFKDKEMQGESKRKTKAKDKSSIIRKCYKLIAPHPGGCIDAHNLTTGKIAPAETGYIVDPGASGCEVGDRVYEVKVGEDAYTETPLLTDFDSFGKEGKTEDVKRKIAFEAKIKCFRCYACPFVTVSADAFTYHIEKKDKCFPAMKSFHCPGCKNVFHSLTSLRVHLVHDHKTSQKEVKLILQSVREVEPDATTIDAKSSCAFDSAGQIVTNGHLFDQTGSEADITAMATTMTGRDELTKGSYVECTNPRNYGGGEELEPCLSSKRQTMLESYLDDISHKGDCNLPPALAQNGTDLLENTFNFTAPVSEQLPSIQPPPAHSNVLLDHSHHLMVSQQASHGDFVEIANVFPGHRTDEEQYKPGESGHGYDGDSNLMLGNGGYLPPHHQHEMHDIPVMNLDESHVIGKQTENILSQDINMDDFNAYNEGALPTLDAAETPCRLTVEDDDQEKKKLKKLGVGYRCDINGCKVRLQSEKNIQYHRRCHEGTLYNCPECCKDCSTWVSLSSHLWQAHKIDMELYKCDQCPYKTPSYSRLTNIHRGIHGKARPFLCDVCGKGFKTVKQMRNHKNIHKAKMVRMSVCHCDICGRTVADKRQLELHINNTHRKKKPYLCYMCGYASAVKHSLVVHMRRHTGEKPYECEKCDYKTADHNALRRHKMKHTGVRNYKCNHCSYTCIQASTYKVHIKTKHPGLESDLIFGCGQCNFQTLNRGSFLSHTSEHENYNVEARKQGGRSQAAKATPDSGQEYYDEPNRLDLVGPIMTEGVVETIVDLSGAQTLLEDDYYERITGDLENAHELKFKTSGIT